MGQFAGFQVYEHKALEQVIVKNQVNIIMVGFATDTVLPAHKRKAFAQLQQELLQVFNQGGFYFSFGSRNGLRYIQKFKYIRVFDKIM